MRKFLCVSMALVLVSLLVFLYWAFLANSPALKVRAAKETTYITEPVDADGYLDYQAALNDRLSKGITLEENANVLVWKALGPTPEGGTGMSAEYFKWLGIDEPPRDGDYFVGLFKYMREQLKLQPEEEAALLDQQLWATRRPWAAKDYPRIASWIEVNDKPLATILEATKRRDYFNPLVSKRRDNEPSSLVSALLPNVQKCRELSFALASRAMLRVREGKFDAAWQDLLACHRLARLVARGGTFIETLVGIAIDSSASQADLGYLEQANLTSKQIQERLKDLQALSPMSPVADKVDLERFMYLEAMQLIRRQGPGLLEGLEHGGPIKKSTPRDIKKMAQIDWEPILINGNQWYDQLAAAMRLKDRAERKKALTQIENNIKALKQGIPDANGFSQFLLDKQVRGKAIGDTLLTLLLPAVGKIEDSHDRGEQTERNLHVAFALAAHHAEHGRYPAKLDDLVPEYLTTIPDDLFLSQTLHYCPTDPGYLLYSVGVNGVDDGGRSYDDEPPGDDLTVRMPLPELKRKK